MWPQSLWKLLYIWFLHRPCDGFNLISNPIKWSNIVRHPFSYISSLSKSWHHALQTASIAWQRTLRSTHPNVFFNEVDYWVWQVQASTSHTTIISSHHMIWTQTRSPGFQHHGQFCGSRHVPRARLSSRYQSFCSAYLHTVYINLSLTSHVPSVSRRGWPW